MGFAPAPVSVHGCLSGPALPGGGTGRLMLVWTLAVTTSDGDVSSAVTCDPTGKLPLACSTQLLNSTRLHTQRTESTAGRVQHKVSTSLVLVRVQGGKREGLVYDASSIDIRVSRARYRR